MLVKDARELCKTFPDGTPVVITGEVNPRELNGASIKGRPVWLYGTHWRKGEGTLAMVFLALGGSDYPGVHLLVKPGDIEQYEPEKYQEHIRRLRGFPIVKES